jgi:carbon-monoxide dehydrogenase large subunit
MSFARHEDKRLVTGAGKFSADWNLPGQLHACMVRSPYAHAKVLSVDTSAALEKDGVVAVFTAADVTAARMNPLPSGPDLKGVNDTPINKGLMPILAIDRVRFVGQPVAMVLAESANVARDASELVNVTYEELPVVANVDSALADGAPLLHPNIPGNVSLQFESGDAEATEAAFAAAAKTTSLTINSQRLTVRRSSHGHWWLITIRHAVLPSCAHQRRVCWGCERRSRRLPGWRWMSSK